MSGEPAAFRSSAQTPKRWLHVRELASGGMGRVDLVLRRDGAFERLYARKRLHPHLREDAEAERMFVDEARIAGLLRHPNVVSVIEVDADAEGAFLLMDYVEGVSLGDFIREHGAQGAKVPIQLCLRIAAQVARGLHAAHTLADARGEFLALVHRDVSPQNVLIGFDGLARLTDFGIARAVGRSSNTSAGVLKGKLRYMSPEQLRFERPDFRADLFSLGVVLFELIAAERMFPSSSEEEIARAILLDPPRDLADVRADVPSAVVELLFEMLAKDPEGRPSSAAEIAARLDAVVDELARDEEAVDVGSYLERWFGAQRDASRREITDRIRTLVSDEPIASDVGSRSARARLGWAAAVLVAVVGVAMLVAVRHSRAAPQPAAASSEEEAPASASVLETRPAPSPEPPTVSASPTATTAGNGAHQQPRLYHPRRGATHERPAAAAAPSAAAAPPASLFRRWE